MVDDLPYRVELHHAVELEIELVLDGETQQQRGERVETEVAGELRVFIHSREVERRSDECQNLFEAV